MSLTSETVRIAYVANGILTTFAIPFTIIESADDEVKVYTRDESTDPATEELQVNSTDYSLTGNPVDTVTFAVAPASGLKVILIRQLERTQSVDVNSNSEVIAATTMETAWDRGVALSQQLQEQVDRSLLLPITSQTTGLTLPEPTAASYLRWNEAETGLENAVVVTATGSLTTPGSSVNNGVVLWNGTGGNAIKSSTFTLPGSATDLLNAGTITNALITDGTISKVKLDATTTSMSSEVSNLSLTATVASSALTIALKGQDGNNASASNPVTVGFRSVTAASGLYTRVQITSALSLVISSGSTLGMISAVASYIYVYLLNNAGTAELAVSLTLFDEGTVISSLAEGGAGAADAASGLYSTASRSNVPCRLIGRLLATEATAGTWATAPSEISLRPFKVYPVSFRAHGSTTVLTNNATVTLVYTTKDYDTHNSYSTSTGIFTCPSGGKYLVCAGMKIAGFAAAAISSSVFMQISVTGTIVTSGDGAVAYTTTSIERNLKIEEVVVMTAGDTLSIGFSHGMGATPTIANQANTTYFSATKLD